MLGYPVRMIDWDNASAFFLAERQSLFLLSIGFEESRVKVEDLLQRVGLKPGKDYLRFI